jgi:hypothetical protein
MMRRSGEEAVVVVETFVVRLWQPADDREVQSELHGVVQRVGEDTVTPFRSAIELLALLQVGQTAGRRGDTSSG